MIDWIVDLEKCTATHPDGWVFRFSPVDGEPGTYDGECIGQPENLTPAQLDQVASIAQQAGTAFIEARNARS